MKVQYVRKEVDGKKYDEYFEVNYNSNNCFSARFSLEEAEDLVVLLTDKLRYAKPS